MFSVTHPIPSRPIPSFLTSLSGGSWIQDADRRAREALFAGIDRKPTNSVPRSAVHSTTRPVSGLLDTVRTLPSSSSSSQPQAAESTTGVLGEWELYKLRKIYTEMDTDKSGYGIRGCGLG